MEADKAYFDSISWCSQLVNAPNVTFTPADMRVCKDNTRDSLLAETMKTPDTISHWLIFHYQPNPDSARINQLNSLITFGSALDGYPGVAHGGVVATVLDETLGRLVVMNKERGGIPDIGVIVTGNLNITYLRPVTTPQTVLVSAFFKEINGRKVSVHATVKDGSGVTLAKAESLWLGVQSPKEKL